MGNIEQANKDWKQIISTDTYLTPIFMTGYVKNLVPADKGDNETYEETYFCDGYYTLK